VFTLVCSTDWTLWFSSAWNTPGCEGAVAVTRVDGPIGGTMLTGEIDIAMAYFIRSMER
jgi:hypothetical protein